MTETLFPDDGDRILAIRKAILTFAAGWAAVRFVSGFGRTRTHPFDPFDRYFAPNSRRRIEQIAKVEPNGFDFFEVEIVRILAPARSKGSNFLMPIPFDPTDANMVFQIKVPSSAPAARPALPMVKARPGPVVFWFWCL